MSFLKIFRKLNNYIGTHKVHLCPAVKGRLMNNGKPLINATITRTLSYFDGKYTEDMCNTDNDGYFSKPEKSLRSSQPALLIAEMFTNQRIYTHYYGEEYLLWSSINTGIKLKPEFSAKLQSLNGDIKNEEIFSHLKVMNFIFRLRHRVFVDGKIILKKLYLMMIRIGL